MKIKAKKQKGITLIALVVTIVVLILLAVVSINLVFGEQGIIARAQSADDIQAGAVEKDKEALAQLGSKIDEHTGEKVEEGTILAAYINGELVQGDYLDYTPDEAEAYDPDQGTVGSLTGYSTAQSIQQDDLNWRVLGREGDNILLISEVATTSTIRCYGSVGFANFIDVFNDTCNALYSNESLGVTARSMNAEDAEDYLGGTVSRIDCTYSNETINLIQYIECSSELFDPNTGVNDYREHFALASLGAPCHFAEFGHVNNFGACQSDIGLWYDTWCCMYGPCGFETASDLDSQDMRFRPVVVVPGSTSIDEMPKIEV